MTTPIFTPAGCSGRNVYFAPVGKNPVDIDELRWHEFSDSRLADVFWTQYFGEKFSAEQIVEVCADWEAEQT